MMGTKDNPAAYDCYANALPDEPMFVLLARDPDAPRLVEEWARKRQADIDRGARPKEDQEMVSEAMACAIDMIVWREINSGKWRKP